MTLATDPRPVVLVGLMGAGKTTIGRRLAAALRLPFHDADAEIEQAAGCTVSEFFTRFGEPAFREGERKVIARLLEGPRHVLATGGGAFADTETRALIKQKAVSVWLKADLDLLMSRVSRKSTRPLLQTADPRAVMQSLMDARYPLYAEADIAVETGHGPHEAVVKTIVQQLKSYTSAGAA